MFEREITLNTMLIEGFKAVIKDIPDNEIYQPAPGNGHPPVWVLGHLAICAELGQKHCGGSIAHMEWLRIFGPGSSDEIEDTGQFTKRDLAGAVIEGYGTLAELARNTDEASMSAPHGVALLEATPIQTVGDLVAHLLTSHFSFHWAQLSGWRRAAGHGPLI